MDLIIELIVWLLRSLFGDPEKPADMQRGNRTQTGPRQRRGPYGYGDEKSGGQPKTQEEILEEVRQQAAQRGGPPAAPPPPPSPPPPRRQRPEPKAQPVEEPEFKPRRLVDLTIEQAPALAPAAPAPVAALESRVELAHLQPLGTVEARTLRAEALPSETRGKKHAALPSEGPKRARKQRPRLEEQRAPAAAQVNQLDMLRAIREAPPQAKLVAARQAMMLFEVFGAPRALRPHRPGRGCF